MCDRQRWWKVPKDPTCCLCRLEVGQPTDPSLLLDLRLGDLCQRHIKETLAWVRLLQPARVTWWLMHSYAD